MKPQIAKLWCEALRSGEFKQGTGKLRQVDEHDGKKYCCLGILCELYSKDLEKKKKPSTNLYYKNLLLPLEVQKWAGFRVDVGICFNKYKGKDGLMYSSLSSLNDSGITFKGIANIIEKEVENL